jgi:lactobin A/cerein 7B family class IIb bacteriocin
MNIKIDENKDQDINALNDAQLDDVNGGLWFLAAAAYLVGVGAVAGYYATRRLMN